MAGSRNRRLAALAAQGAAILVCLSFSATLLLPRLLGWEVMTVLTGSMRPTYPPATVVAVAKTPAKDIAAGDVIAFRMKPDGPPVTHRVVALKDTPTGREFTTKGDGNEEADPKPVAASAVMGRVVFGIPRLGRVVGAIRSPIGFAGIFLVLGLLLSGERFVSRRPRHRNTPTGAGDRVTSPPLQAGAAAHAWPAAPSLVSPLQPAQRQLLLATVVADIARRRELLDLRAIYGGSVVSLSHTRLTVSLTAEPDRIREFTEMLAPFEVEHVVRSEPLTLGPLVGAPPPSSTVPPKPRVWHAFSAWSGRRIGRHSSRRTRGGPSELATR
jgi:signal peptidase